MSPLTMFPKKIFILIRALAWLCWGANRNKFQKVRAVYRYGGIGLCWQMAALKFAQGQSAYNALQNQLTPAQSRFLLSRCPRQPLISVVVPVYRIDPAWLEACIRSVCDQHYSNWELVLVDDASGSEALKHLILEYGQKDRRIRHYFLERNVGIAEATNTGIKAATGEFVGFLDHDDELTPDALSWVVWSIHRNPQAQWLYSDEDLITAKGKCCNPHFKPDFSPEHLLSHMFTCHFSVYSKILLDKAGGLRRGYDGAQDHELALRLSEMVKPHQVVHIPRVLYHWRILPTSTAANILAKPKAPAAGKKAVSDALQRRGLLGEVTNHPLCPTLYQVRLKAGAYPSVTIVIPTRNQQALLEQCLNSIEAKTNYPNYRITVVDNQSDDRLTLDFIRRKQQEGCISVLSYDAPFNYSAMNNEAAMQTGSELIVFMNNDVEIITPDWLDIMVATIQMDDAIGVAGGLLMYQDGTVQHGGVTLGVNLFSGHSHHFVPAKSLGYNCRLQSLQELSALTAALMIVNRKTFLEVGGFDAKNYPVVCSDIELCLRMKKHGYRCVYNPMVQAIHHESKSRMICAEDYASKRKLRNAYPELFDYDPFYNANLALNNEQFSGYRDFPVVKQIPELKELDPDENGVRL